MAIRFPNLGDSSLDRLTSMNQFRAFSPEADFSMDDESLGPESRERVYAFRPAIPQSAEEASEVLLDKLEQAGRVPSKEKFRRMACNVIC